MSSWETRCFFPVPRGDVSPFVGKDGAVSGASLLTVLSSWLSPVIDMHVPTSAPSDEMTAVESRTDVYVALPPHVIAPASSVKSAPTPYIAAASCIGMKLRGVVMDQTSSGQEDGKVKLEIKVASLLLSSSASNPPSHPPSFSSGMWSKFKTSLKHGLHKPKKVSKFIRDDVIPHLPPSGIGNTSSREGGGGDDVLIVPPLEQLLSSVATLITDEGLLLQTPPAASSQLVVMEKHRITMPLNALLIGPTGNASSFDGFSVECALVRISSSQIGAPGDVYLSVEVEAPAADGGGPSVLSSLAASWRERLSVLTAGDMDGVCGVLSYPEIATEWLYAARLKRRLTSTKTDGAAETAKL